MQHLKQHFDAKGKSLVSVAVAWVLAQPGITSAIIGASKPEQLSESLAAVSMTLDEQDREACNLAWFSLPRPCRRRGNEEPSPPTPSPTEGRGGARILSPPRPLVGEGVGG